MLTDSRQAGNENGDTSIWKPAEVPSVSLPTGGGAIRGIGETFALDLWTGMGSFSIPIPLTPSRRGFGPQLAFQHGARHGNGVFGLGWDLAIQRVSRKTEKGRPRHGEDEGFVLSGAEDAFARIKQWIGETEPDDVQWRAMTRENITSVYGRGVDGRRRRGGHV